MIFLGQSYNMPACHLAFNENCRKFTVNNNPNMGKMIEEEVGAMLVVNIDIFSLQMQKGNSR